MLWPKRPPLAFYVAEMSVAEMSWPKCPWPKRPWPKYPTFVFNIYAHGSHVGHVTSTMLIDFLLLIHKSSPTKVG